MMYRYKIFLVIIIVTITGVISWVGLTGNAPGNLPDCLTGDSVEIGKIQQNLLNSNPGHPYKEGNSVNVTLINFEILLRNDSAELSWKAENVSKSGSFIIERSVNGLDFFSIAGSKEVKKIQNEYCFTDTKVPEGTIYYRLKHVNPNESSSLLDIVSVNNKELSNNCKLKISPDPCQGKCVISLENCPDKDLSGIQFNVYDALGNVVYTQLPENIAGEEFAASKDENPLAPCVFVIKKSKSE